MGAGLAAGGSGSREEEEAAGLVAFGSGSTRAVSSFSPSGATSRNTTPSASAICIKSRNRRCENSVKSVCPPSSEL